MNQWNGELPDDEDDEVPEALRDRWARRDRQYGSNRSVGSKQGALSPAEIAAIRSWRMGEAEEIGDPALIEEARTWGLML